MAWGDVAWGEGEWGSGNTAAPARTTGTFGRSPAYNGDQYAGEPLTSQAQLPAAPISLIAVLGVASYIDLSWVGSANTVTFEVERSTDGGGTWSSLSSTVTVSLYADTTTLFGTTYTYRVRGINAVGSGPWSSTVALTPVGDDGDYLYLYANVAPILVESDSDYLYVYANAVPIFAEADGDYLYIYAYNEPSAPAVGLIMGAPAGTLFMYGTAPPTGLLLSAPPGAPIQFIPGTPVGFLLEAPPGNPLQVIIGPAVGLQLGAPAGIATRAPTMILYAYENVGVTTTLDRSLVLQAYENVGIGFLSFPYVGRVVAVRANRSLVLQAYANVT